MAEIIPFPAINRVAKIDNTTLMFLERRDERSEGIPYLQSVINAMAKQSLNNGVLREAAQQEALRFLKAVCDQAHCWGYTLSPVAVDLEVLDCRISWCLEQQATDHPEPAA